MWVTDIISLIISAAFLFFLIFGDFGWPVLGNMFWKNLLIFLACLDDCANFPACFSSSLFFPYFVELCLFVQHAFRPPSPLRRRSDRLTTQLTISSKLWPILWPTLFYSISLFIGASCCFYSVDVFPIFWQMLRWIICTYLCLLHFGFTVLTYIWASSFSSKKEAIG